MPAGWTPLRIVGSAICFGVGTYLTGRLLHWEYNKANLNRLRKGYSHEQMSRRRDEPERTVRVPLLGGNRDFYLAEAQRQVAEARGAAEDDTQPRSEEPQ